MINLFTKKAKAEDLDSLAREVGKNDDRVQCDIACIRADIDEIDLALTEIATRINLLAKVLGYRYQESYTRKDGTVVSGGFKKDTRKDTKSAKKGMRNAKKDASASL